LLVERLPLGGVYQLVLPGYQHGGTLQLMVMGGPIKSGAFRVTKKLAQIEKKRE
jgi:hypothetical protein